MSASHEERKIIDDAYDEANFHRDRYKTIVGDVRRMLDEQCSFCAKWKSGECPVDCIVDKIKEQLPDE